MRNGAFSWYLSLTNVQHDTKFNYFWCLNKACVSFTWICLCGKFWFVYFRAREALRQCLPEYLKDNTTFAICLKDDTSTKRWLAQLMKNLQEVTPSIGDPRGIPLPPWYSISKRRESRLKLKLGRHYMMSMGFIGLMMFQKDGCEKVLGSF